MRNKPVSRHQLAARLLVFALVQVFTCASALAASDEERINELERKLDESVKLINQLSKELQQLKSESRRPQPQAAAPASTEALANKVSDLEQQVSAIGNRPEEDHGLDMHGFADVGFSAAGAAHATGAKIGALDFYLTPRFTDRIKGLFELNFECCSDGAIGTDLERMQIGYTASDWMTVWAGRFHTPFGYWNTAFHHGQQLQTSVLRPQMIDFEDHGGVIPVHTVGVWGSGAVPTKNGRLTYDLFGGNSPSINANTLDPNNSGKQQPGYSAGFNLGYLFGGAAEGLKIGMHGYRAVVRDDSVALNISRVNILGGY